MQEENPEEYTIRKTSARNVDKKEDRSTEKRRKTRKERKNPSERSRHKKRDKSRRKKGKRRDSKTKGKGDEDKKVENYGSNKKLFSFIQEQENQRRKSKEDSKMRVEEKDRKSDSPEIPKVDVDSVNLRENNQNSPHRDSVLAMADDDLNVFKISPKPVDNLESRSENDQGQADKPSRRRDHKEEVFNKKDGSGKNVAKDSLGTPDFDGSPPLNKMNQISFFKEEKVIEERGSPIHLKKELNRDRLDASPEYRRNREDSRGEDRSRERIGREKEQRSGSQKKSRKSNKKILNQEERERRARSKSKKLVKKLLREIKSERSK